MGYKILIADDEDLIVQLIADEFRQMGHTVYTALDGKQALEL